MSAAPGSQKVKRNAASPSSVNVRQGPLRATQQFALVNGSPSRKQAVRQGLVYSPTSKSNKSSKTTRSHSETAFVCDRRSPTSPVFKVEKPNALRATSSVDNINLYLSGQWPKDSGSKKQRDGLSDGHVSPPYYSDGVFRKDTQTQTPEEWESESKRQLSHSKLALYKRSKSVGSNDSWSLKSSKDIKAKLQRKDYSKGSQALQRFSPVSAISTSFSSPPVKIPIPTRENGVLRGTPGKARGSVEGHNTEIEKLITSATDVQCESTAAAAPLFDCPDGHRAPLPDMMNITKNAQSQTLSQSELFLNGDRLLELSISDYSGRCSSRASTETDEGSRPQSISPSPFLLGPLDMEETGSDSGETPRLGITTATSPRPNNSAHFIRLPPDGAEKLKSVVETATPQRKNLIAPIFMSTMSLQPSERSAFSSLGKSSVMVPSTSPIRFVEETH